MNKVSPQEILKSKTKWYLGGAREVIWAPDFPTQLDSPGFWDNACFLEWKVEPLYMITLLDENLVEIPMRLKSREWIPSKLTQVYEAADNLSVVEEKCLLPNDVMVSELNITNTGKQQRTIYAVVWTSAVCGKPRVSGQYRDDFKIKDKFFSYKITQFSDKGEEFVNINFALGVKGGHRSFAVNSSETCVSNPKWLFTPAFERMTIKGLDNSFIISGGHKKELNDNVVYAAMEKVLNIPPKNSQKLTSACTLAGTYEKAIRQIKEGLGFQDPMKVSYENWESFFNKVPVFESSDKYFSKYYWYRWYGLKLNMGIFDRESHPYPFICEGMNWGWFRQHISYSAQCHMLEMRWMNTPEVAQGSLLNFVHSQSKDGAYPGAVPSHAAKRTHFIYHANWGLGVRKVYESHPDKEFLKIVYSSLEKYISYFDKVRDKEKSNLYDVINQAETGQEYMSRYLYVDKKGDQWGELKTHLKGVDATVYIYELVRTIAWIAGKLGYGNQTIAKWNRKADKIKKAVLEKMWDSKTKIFRDLNSKTMKKSPVKTAVLFYPFMTDIPGSEHLSALYNHLLNSKEFWTEYPCATTSIDDPFYNVYGEWKGQRKHCPWNGRSWLMTNSHIAEILVTASERLDEKLKKQAIEFIRKFFRMVFIDGDINKPSSYEYYNPVNGKAPFFRGVDDYMHSWMNELLFKYVCGIRTTDDNTLTIKPLDFGLSHFSLDRFTYRGKEIRIIWRKTGSDNEPAGLTIFVDGKKIKSADGLEEVHIEI